MYRRSTNNSPARPDMTPMLDVVFILPIFFLVTTSFVQEKGVALVRAPDTTDHPSTDSSTRQLYFSISNEDKLFENGRHIDIWAAEALIKQQYTEAPKIPILIEPQVGASLGALIRLYDGAKHAGLPTENILIL